MTRTLTAYHPTLKVTGWRAIKPPSTDKVRQDTSDKYLLVFQLLESQVRALAALDYRP